MSKRQAKSRRAKQQKQWGRLRLETAALRNRRKREADRWYQRAKRYTAAEEKIAAPIRAKIVKALTYDGRLSGAEAKEAAFHLTDWILDLQELNGLFDARRWNFARASRVLVSFVIHVPAHLAAAHRTILGEPLTDVFEIGAVKGSGRGKQTPGAAYTVRRGESRNR